MKTVRAFCLEIVPLCRHFPPQQIEASLQATAVAASAPLAPAGFGNQALLPLAFSLTQKNTTTSRRQQVPQTKLFQLPQAKAVQNQLQAKQVFCTQTNNENQIFKGIDEVFGQTLGVEKN